MTWLLRQLLVVGVAFVASVVFIGLIAPALGEMDGTLFPVTSKVRFIPGEDAASPGEYIEVRMHFEKLRDCEFLGVSADRDGVSIRFEPVEGGQATTLATGDRLSRPWRLYSGSLDGLRLRWVHRCNPLWVTVTLAYP